MFAASLIHTTATSGGDSATVFVLLNTFVLAVARSNLSTYERLARVGGDRVVALCARAREDGRVSRLVALPADPQKSVFVLLH